MKQTTETKKFIVHTVRTRKVCLDIEIEAASPEEAEKKVLEGIEAGAYETYYSELESTESDKYEIDWTEEDYGEFAGWEALVCTSLAGLLNCTYSDAQGIIEAQEFYVAQSWAKGLNPMQTAALISEKSKA